MLHQLTRTCPVALPDILLLVPDKSRHDRGARENGLEVGSGAGREGQMAEIRHEEAAISDLGTTRAGGVCLIR
jgi:hypothetical protein